MDPIVTFQIILDVIRAWNAFISGLTTLLALTGNTPPPLAIDNKIVTSAWEIMLAVADGFLLLFVLTGGIQMMLGQMTMTNYLPPRVFLPKLGAIALAMHASFFWLRMLVIFNNELCGVVHASVQTFVKQLTGGQLPGGIQEIALGAVLGAVFSLTILRYIYQCIERIVLLNLLLVLAPFGMLLFFLPSTQAHATYYHRMFVVTCFQQFVQFLAFGLGVAFLEASGMMNGLDGIILGTGLMFLVTQIPRLLYRLSGTGGGGGGELGGLFRMAVDVARLFAA